MLLAMAAVGTLPKPAMALSAAGAQPDEVIDLWPGKPPGGEQVTVVQESVQRNNTTSVDDRAISHVTRPTLTLFRPPAGLDVDKPGPALLVIPGGGYQRVVVGHEGMEIARMLIAHGFTVGVLLYRLPGDGWAAGPDTPLQDVQRAMRLMRAHAARLQVDPERIGVQGFSAGGHVAASVLTRFDAKVYQPVDVADMLSARPAYGSLGYPVITMQASWAHPGSRALLLGATPSDELVARYSADQTVTASTPPTWIMHASDDKTVPVENSWLMYSALRRAGVRSELHVFDQGGHGFGLSGVADKTVAAWPTLFLDWVAKLPSGVLNKT
jgi:acetyl esterase/lipase